MGETCQAWRWAVPAFALPAHGRWRIQIILRLVSAESQTRLSEYHQGRLLTKSSGAFTLTASNRPVLRLQINAPGTTTRRYRFSP